MLRSGEVDSAAGRTTQGWITPVAAVVTGLLMAAAFPPLEWAETAWIAWVPMLLICFRGAPREAFRLGYAAGALYWLCVLAMLTPVTRGGWILLSLYCALYTGAFAWLTAWLVRVTNRERVIPTLGFMLLIPVLWSGFEFLRSILFTGFPWNPLGGSQYANIHIIQLSVWTGVYGVSALVMFINVAAALTLDRYIRAGLRGRRAWHPELMIGFAVLFAVISAGGRSIRAAGEEGEEFRTALIQPNIPQYEKWTREFVDTIYDRLQSLTQLAIYAGEPDLVIWPETAVPDYVRESRRSHEMVRNLTRLGAPILVGSMDIAWTDEAVPRFYNSSMLFDRAGSLTQTYDKQHLVMFGEYIPLRRFLPFMKAMTPIEESFDPGKGSTLFVVPETDATFSVLICFEDAVPRLARQAVRKGARLLVNQTNDAWFEETSAAWQHMTHSVFRAVENRTPMVRAANTGVSTGIDRFGRVHDLLADETGNTFVAGFKIVTSRLPPAERDLTFYTRYGDVFGWTALFITSVLCAFFVRRMWHARGQAVEVQTP